MSYVSRGLAALPFGNLIGAPMTSAIEAQSAAAQATVDFIEKVGFQHDPANASDPFFQNENSDAKFGNVRNVTFTYKKVNEEDEEVNATLTVPILTIVPIPFLRIEEMNIDFMAKMKESQRYSRLTKSESKGKYSAKVSGGWGPIKFRAQADYSSRHSSSTESNSRYQTEATMNVSVRAVQDELPAGLSRVLSIMEGVIKEDLGGSGSSGSSSSSSST